MSARRVAAVLLGAALAAAIALAGPAATARAAAECTVTWNGGAGAWSDATRWTPARVPTDADRACLVRTTGAAPVSVRVDARVGVDRLVVDGATVVLGADAYLDANAVRASAASVVAAPGGALVGQDVELHDTRLAGADVVAVSRLFLDGRFLFTRGASITTGRSANVFLQNGLRALDGDGDPGNRIALHSAFLYPSSLFIGVHLSLLGDTSLFATQGTVVLADLDNLSPDGTLSADFRGRLQIGAVGSAEVVLPRGVTRIGPRVGVQAGTITSSGGSDALSGLRIVDGDLYLQRPLDVAALNVRGSIIGSGPLTAPTVLVGGRLETPVTTDALTCAGTCVTPGSGVRDLTVASGGTLASDAGAPLTVRGRATLAGTLLVRGSTGPTVGDTLVLLTAAGGVSGMFEAVTTDDRSRRVGLRYAPTYVTGRFSARG